MDGALTLVDARHAELAAGRVQAEETLVALRTVGLDAQRLETRSREPLRIGEAARRVGVRVSTLRFWERQGVLFPIRARANRYRLFGEQDLIQLQVVALLRRAGYGFVAIRSVLDELGGGEVAKAVSAVEERKVQLAQASRRCAAATSALWTYLEEWPPGSGP